MTSQPVQISAEGIGSADVGIKRGVLVSDEVVTETGRRAASGDLLLSVAALSIPAKSPLSTITRISVT